MNDEDSPHPKAGHPLLGAINTAFSVQVTWQELESCRTVGDLERVVYDQVQIGMLGLRQHLYEKLLSRASLGGDCGWKPITFDHLDLPIDEVARRRAGRHWQAAYQSIQGSFAHSAPHLTLTAGSKVTMLVMLTVVIGVLCWFWLSYSVSVALSTTLLSLLALGLSFVGLPVKPSRPVETVGDYLKSYAEKVEGVHRDLSLVEVQYRTRSLCESWAETLEPRTVHAETPLADIL